MGQSPLIKGIFINSHIEKLRHEKGEDAILELELRFGRPIVFNDLSDYPVRDEVVLLEHVLDLLNNDSIAASDRSFEAGRLHFKDFAETEFGKMIMSTARRDEEGFKKLLLRANWIAGKVFKHTNFESRLDEETAVLVTMENGDYPEDHFRGLFYEWALYWGLPDPQVSVTKTTSRGLAYRISWGG